MITAEEKKLEDKAADKEKTGGEHDENGDFDFFQFVYGDAKAGVGMDGAAVEKKVVVVSRSKRMAERAAMLAKVSPTYFNINPELRGR